MPRSLLSRAESAAAEPSAFPSCACREQQRRDGRRVAAGQSLCHTLRVRGDDRRGNGNRGGANVNSWPKRVGAITLFIEDVERSKAFYQNIFGLPVTYEDENSVVFTFENTLINLLKLTAADELIAPEVVAGRAAGSRFQFTIWVENTDAVCAELASRGVALLNGPMDRRWGQRTASFTDPDGHIWEIAQTLP
jgi:lactoylglutathione lyase